MSWLADWLRHKTLRRAFRRDEFIEREVAHFVGGITIMPNNICNADCVFCAYRFNEEPKDTMSLDLFKRAIDETFTLGYLGTVVLTPVAGEPLADPTLFDKIAYAKAKGVQNIIFTTNGILLLKNENWRRCVDAGLFQLNISSPGLSDDAYRRLYRSKRYPAIMEGLLKLLNYKEQCGAKFELNLMLRIDRPLDEVMNYDGMKIVKPYFDRGTIRPLDIRNEFDNWSGHITESDLIGTMRLIAPKEKPVPCDRMIHDLAVLPDGKVRVCSCRYYRTNHDELVIGDITKQPMAEIHFGPRHRQLLKEVASGKWPRVCDNCSLYQQANVKIGH
jgi:molybdenum cofactor biosynthesis enzyme MoaA